MATVRVRCRALISVLQKIYILGIFGDGEISKNLLELLDPEYKDTVTFEKSPAVCRRFCNAWTKLKYFLRQILA
jgi:hypothetical protein